MASKASKGKPSKTAGRGKKVKMADLQVPKGGSVKGGTTNLKTYYK